MYNIKTPTFKDVLDFERFRGTDNEKLGLLVQRMLLDEDGERMFDSIEEIDLDYDETVQVGIEIAEKLNQMAGPTDPLAEPSSATQKSGGSASNKPRKPRSKK